MLKLNIFRAYVKQLNRTRAFIYTRLRVERFAPVQTSTTGLSSLLAEFDHPKRLQSKSIARVVFRSQPTCEAALGMRYTLSKAYEKSMKACVPRYRKERSGKNGFSVSSPQLWNLLPADIRLLHNEHQLFRKRLKTHYMQQSMLCH